MPDYMRDYGLRLFDRGYQVLPIVPGDKRPAVDDFLAPVDRKKIEHYISNGFADFGVGIQAESTPLLDVDIRDRARAIEVRHKAEQLFGKGLIRIGQAPKFGLPFRVTKSFRKVQSRAFVDELGRKAQVEFLGDGQQWVAYHIHPDIHKPYRWPAGELIDTSRSDLPEVTEGGARELVEWFEAIASEEWGWRLQRRATTVPAIRRGTADPDYIGADPNERMEDVSDETFAEWVMAIPNDEKFNDRDDWYRFGMAIHHQMGAAGEDVWHEWSNRRPQGPGLVEKAWKSFGVRSENRELITGRWIKSLYDGIHGEEVKLQVADLLGRLGLATTEEDLKSVCSECKRLETDVADRSALADELKKAYARILNRTLDIRSARSMVTYDPASAGMPDWLKPWVYLEHVRKFFNVADSRLLDREAFDLIHRRHVLDPVDFAVRRLRLPTYFMSMYLPSAEGGFFHDGQKFINTYREPELVPMPAVLTRRDLLSEELVENHFYHLFGSVQQREIELFLSWLAFIVQTKQRPNWAILMQGAEAIGKTFVADLMAVCLGAAHVRTYTTDTIIGKFTHWAQGQLLIFIEELRIEGPHKFEVMNRIKPLISNTTIEIHPKNVNPYNVINTSAYLAATNFVNAIPLSAADTRWFVLLSQWQDPDKVNRFKRDNPNYYKRLFSTLQKSPGHLRKWLSEYRLHPEFDPAARAPASRGRREIIQQSKSDAEMVFEETIAEDNVIGVSKELILISALGELLNDEEGFTGSRSHRMAAFLRDRGYRRGLERIKIDGRKEYVWWKAGSEFDRDDPAISARLVRNYLKKRSEL